MKEFFQEHNLMSDRVFGQFTYVYRQNCISCFSALLLLSVNVFSLDRLPLHLCHW